jgi:hypothetical protein
MLKRTILVQTLALAFGAMALDAALIQPVFAQSNASGNITGRVDNAAGTTVVLNNTQTGLRRTVTPDANGRYQASALPAGHYTAQLMRDGAVAGTTEVDVLIGQSVDASFIAAAASGTQQVRINGRRSRIDVTNADNGATFTAKELASLPIQQNLASIIQLAPNTNSGDPRYGNGASMGGGAATENSYYINGMTVVNPLTGLGSSELPFGAIAQVQVLTGGYSAEFGRSVGGVTNITTKSGTNTWQFGANMSIEPNSTRASRKNVYYANTGANPETDGTLYARNDQDTETEKRYGVYVGGPIIKDKLFMFLAAEQIRNSTSEVAGTSDSISNAQNGWADVKSKTTRYLGKFDWNITDDHRLEWTTIGDKPESDWNYSDYDYATGAHTGQVSSGGHYESIANKTPTTGAQTNILKYTGNLTDNFTLSALIGRSKDRHVANLNGYDASVPGIVQSSSQTAPPAGLTLTNPQPFAGTNIANPYSYDTVLSKRLDLEWKLGDHTLRAGIDNNKTSSFGAGEATAGGYTWVYAFSKTPTVPTSLQGYTTTIANGTPLGNQGYYVYKSVFSDITQAYSQQSAQYLEDNWQVSKNVLLIIGAREEQYKNKNGSGETFLDMGNQLQPRLQAIWDVNGDASLKVYGSAGRYSVPLPTHIAVRGASRSTLTRQYYTYTGIGADGQPTGLVALTPVTSSDNEFGQEKLAQTVSAQNLRPAYQDEVSFGFDRAWSPDLNFGASFTYRTLKSTIDDYCDGRPFQTYADEHGIDTSNFLVDYAGTGQNLTKVTLSAADMGFPKVHRIYKALNMYLEHPMRNGWYGKVNYTLSRSSGNTEGQTLSSIAQSDVGATESWDHRELMEYSDGLLANDRKHMIKAFGFWNFLPEWTVGGNFTFASGQPETCLGNYPDALIAADTDFPDYGSAYHYCGVNGATVVAPQGSAGRLPNVIRVDTDLVYNPHQVKGLALKIDVFNVFNRQTLQQIDQTYNTGTGSISPTYGTAGPFLGYSAPRSMKFTVEYNHSF